MSEVLKGIVRTKVGSRDSRKLRLQGRIPACIQGAGKSHVNLSLDRVAFLAARRHHEHLFDIELDQGAAETAMVRELQWDALGDSIVHVEFRRVTRGVQTEAEVELKFEGHPQGGILNHLVTHLPVLAIPSKIPDLIVVKVDDLHMGEPLLAGQITLPEGVSLGVDPKLQIATIVTARGVADDEGLEEGEAPEGESLAPTPDPEG